MSKTSYTRVVAFTMNSRLITKNCYICICTLRIYTRRAPVYNNFIIIKIMENLTEIMGDLDDYWNDLEADYWNSLEKEGL